MKDAAPREEMDPAPDGAERLAGGEAPEHRMQGVLGWDAHPGQEGSGAQVGGGGAKHERVAAV